MSARRRWARLGRVTVLVIVLVLLLGGCSAGLAREGAQRFLGRAADTPSAPPPADPVDRLLIQGEDGNLYIAGPDGEERFALTDDASPRRVYGQAAWSPDGSMVAWSELRSDGSRLNTSRFDGTGRQALDVPYLPFYIAWNPNGNQLAYLSNWEVIDGPAIALRLVDVGETGNTAATVASGQPLYFSWSPMGDRLLAHVDGERVEIYDLDGAAQSLVISGGAFPAPQWSPAGEELVYAAAGERTQQLLLTDLAGAPLQTLTDYTGRVTFSLSPDGERVAYVPTENDVTGNTLGPLYVVETGSLRTRELSDRPVVAFFWSPDGSKLAYLALEAVNGRVGTRWYVWDGATTRPYAAFLPSRVLLRDYLPFFDQYAQSHRIWSADSRAFVFAGTLENGEDGIWLQAIDTESTEGAEVTPPVSLGPGVFATWSPAVRR